MLYIPPSHGNFDWNVCVNIEAIVCKLLVYRTCIWDVNDLNLKPYHRCAEEFTVNKTQDILLKENKIVIPCTLQKRATELGHSGHQGIDNTNAILREKIWYPKLDEKVKELIENCIAFQAVGQGNPPEPLKITPTEDTPWTELAIDFFGPIPQSEKYLIVIIDNYTKFLEVDIVNSTEAKTCIPKIDSIFATHGIPEKVKTDNCPPFNGNDFARYMKALRIDWTTSTQLWPQGYSNVESFMKTLKKLIKTSYAEGKNWKHELNKFLLAYRTTSHTTPNVPPCELLFNRKVKGQLPQLKRSRVVKHKFARENIEASK